MSSIFPIPAINDAKYRTWRKRVALQEQERRRSLERLNLRPAVRPHILGSSKIQVARSIIFDVADEYGVTSDDLTGPKLSHHLISPRFDAIYRIAMATDLSLPKIGSLFGGRDHTTILNAFRNHANRNGLSAVRPHLEKRDV